VSNGISRMTQTLQKRKKKIGARTYQT